MRINLSLLLILSVSFICVSQTELKFQIIDSETSEPVSFATVKFKNTNRGIIADYDGEFRIPQNNIKEISIITITSLGYKSFDLVLSLSSFNELNLIKLIPQIETLDTVVINSYNSNKKLSDVINENKTTLAYEIVYKAVNAIKKNLDNRPHSLVGYYRDYQVVDGFYYNLNEGIVEQFDGGINTNSITDSLNKSALYSYKINNNQLVNPNFSNPYNQKSKKIKGAKILPYGGNELTLLNVHNAIRNFDNSTFSFVYRMNNEFLENHFFKKGRVVVNDVGEPIIEILIEKREKLNIKSIYTVEGMLQISLEDYAIYNFKYALFQKYDDKPIFSVQSDFRKENGKMYLNYITFNNNFQIEDDDIFKETNVIYDKVKNRFELTFNSPVDTLQLKKRFFKIKYKNRNIKVKRIEVKSQDKLKIYISQNDQMLRKMTKKDNKDLELVIRGLKDIRGCLIYRAEVKNGYQFREFFVQEVIPNNGLNPKLVYLKKIESLKKAIINKNSEQGKYIINSPLKRKSSY